MIRSLVPRRKQRAELRRKFEREDLPLIRSADGNHWAEDTAQQVEGFASSKQEAPGSGHSTAQTVGSSSCL